VQKINYTRPKLTDYQKAILNSPARFTVTEASTKTGKTASHIVWLLEQALLCKANQAVWWVAPVYNQAEIAFNRMRNQISDKIFFKVNETKLRLTLPTGSIIQFKSAEKPDNLYGDDVYAAVFDEFTRAREEAWFALRSTLTATNGKCKFIGNVKGKKNWGYRLAMKAKSGDDLYQHIKV
jgi:phage terminase large subunit-like protein